MSYRIFRATAATTGLYMLYQKTHTLKYSSCSPAVHMGEHQLPNYVELSNYEVRLDNMDPFRHKFTPGNYKASHISFPIGPNPPDCGELMYRKWFQQYKCAPDHTIIEYIRIIKR